MLKIPPISESKFHEKAFVSYVVTIRNSSVFHESTIPRGERAFVLPEIEACHSNLFQIHTQHIATDVRLCFVRVT